MSNDSDAPRFFYVPWTLGIDTFALGEALGKQVAALHKKPPTVLAVTQAAVARRRWLATQNVVTERSGYVPHDAVVIAWCPTRKLMQKLDIEKVRAVILIEPAATQYLAWAKLVGAYDVLGREVMDAALTDPAREALAGVVWEGYNGWHDDIAETLTHGRLRELLEAGCYDRDLIRQYAEMNDRFHSIGRLERLLDRFEKQHQIAPAQA